MVYVEGGSFMMGDIGYEIPEDEPGGTWVTMEDGRESYRKPFGCTASCYPVHKVTLTGYYLNKFEATYGGYDVYTEANGLPLVAERFRDREEFTGENRPISTHVNWYGAQDYCLWLGEVTGLPFSLPTEAEWEYAARSRGQAVQFATDNGEMEPGRNYRPKGHPYVLGPPGTYPPNPLGLYDMTGNANEWVKDWFSSRYYRQSPELDPQGPEYDNLYATRKVSRGFGIVNSNWYANLVFRRIPTNPENDGSGTGFRCAIHSTTELPTLSELPVKGVDTQVID
ncbi:formylglycine-generating enzyme family protein [Saccharospirillum impatiens]|uniref:formylglycine-generating enzyme family protein n=1 Tax=Saccharospirillum impatiens TaxID=169438 RepID=UPI003CCBC73D